ncbi:hypothetical protein EB796_001135 [Bugula neritina]|uniref:Uncharacterized protein n=1 Tax=Bugula neritina TaxID=10212 RepID=A0A7J7KQW3_BUGNE|nr:hypothetical protein EB796_001135 [Bugula neritina]
MNYKLSNIEHIIRAKICSVKVVSESSYDTVDRVQQVEQEDTPDTYGISIHSLALREVLCCSTVSTAGILSVSSTTLPTQAPMYHHRMKLYKYLIGYKDTFEIYGDDTIADIKEFSFTGKMVFFNEYESYLNLQAGNLTLPASSGSEIANVNMWDRVLSIDVMNRMLWNGNVYSMEKNNLISLSGSVTGKDIEYDSNDHSNLRVKRQAVLDSTTSRVLVQHYSREFHK